MKENTLQVLKEIGFQRIISKGKMLIILHGKMMKNIEEDGYKYLGILEANGVKNEGMKDQIKK